MEVVPEYNPGVGMVVDGHALLFYCDGACRGNGTPRARGTAAVYFGPDHPRNMSEVMPAGWSQTNQGAEL